jgi:hypothetical protein
VFGAANNGPGLVRVTEYLTQQTLSLDFGPIVGWRPNMVSVWGAYRYWAHKFGIGSLQPGSAAADATGHVCCTLEKTAIAGVTVAY